MLALSYSTINNCLQRTNSHNWLNKVQGIKPEDKWYFTAGRNAHGIVQRHVSKKELNTVLETIENIKDLCFPIVEEVDFDPRCKFTYKIPYGEKGEYDLIGFVDGRDEEWEHGLELKFSSQLWSLMKFKNAMQRKVYALGVPTLEDMTLITASKDPAEWEKETPKVFTVPSTLADGEEALQWIIDGIKVLEGGDYTGGLTNGVCLDMNCNWGKNCSFKE